jgi:hypothetical protein
MPAAIEANQNRPCQSSNKAANTENCVHCFTSVTSVRVCQVVELQYTEPNCCQKLVSPHLIRKVDNSVDDVVCNLTNQFFLSITVQPFSGNEHNAKPECVDDVNDQNGIKLSRKVDVSVIEGKSFRSSLDNIAEPLMLNLIGMVRDKKVKIFYCS